MRQVRFLDEGGSVRLGRLDGESIKYGQTELAADEVKILPPCAPSKVIGVGLNYMDHVEEGDQEIPEVPRLFITGPNSLAGHGDVINGPRGREHIAAEAEIAVVISDQCRDVSATDAGEYIAGFTCANDVSNRDDQLDVEKTGRPDMVRGKAFDNATPVGPVLATPDEVPPDAALELRVNGELRQQTTIDNQIFSSEELIEDISSLITLEAGDVILTGTPQGPPRLADGDTVEVSVEGIGTLENTFKQPET